MQVGEALVDFKLYSSRKLEYLDPKTNDVKGVINFKKEMISFEINDSSFDLVTKSRTYNFILTDKNIKSKDWVHGIKYYINKD